MYEHNALGYWSGLALCLTKDRSSRARCPATALIMNICVLKMVYVAEQCTESDLATPMPVSEIPKKEENNNAADDDDDDDEFKTLIKKEAEKSETESGLQMFLWFNTLYHYF